MNALVETPAVRGQPPEFKSTMRPAENNFGWTAEAIETLKRLCGDGYSASQIALAMGVSSRSAVIGKASRLGLNLHGRPTGRPRPARTVPTGQSQTQNSHPVGLRRAQGLGAVAAPAPSGAIALRPTSPGARVGRGVRARSEKKTSGWVDRDVPAPCSIGITILDLTETACKWPQGDPADLETFRYCGAQIEPDNSYCPHHCGLAYVGTSAGYAKATERNTWLMKA